MFHFSLPAQALYQQHLYIDKKAALCEYEEDLS